VGGILTFAAVGPETPSAVELIQPRLPANRLNSPHSTVKMKLGRGPGGDLHRNRWWLTQRTLLLFELPVVAAVKLSHRRRRRHRLRLGRADGEPLLPCVPLCLSHPTLEAFHTT
jgi:hypothetical protein